ncbi:F-box/FBD/LRR-repeat protein At5g53840 [Linum grandiflorum]
MNGEQDNDSSVDRLTHLPDPIIHHILSFLDTKSAVQTSILSPPWKSVWKNVPVVDLYAQSFRKFHRLAAFLHKIFYLRKISYYLDPKIPPKDEQRKLDLVIKYAAAHDAEASIVLSDCLIGNFSELFSRRTRSNCNLKTLTLYGVRFDAGDCPGFPMLTNLYLYDCWFSWYRSVPFHNFPCLKNLVLHDSCWSHRAADHAKVSVPQLITLELKFCRRIHLEIDTPKLESLTINLSSCCEDTPIDARDNGVNFDSAGSALDIKIDAPKLESFTMDFRHAKLLPKFGEMNIPSLDRVDFYLCFGEFRYIPSHPHLCFGEFRYVPSPHRADCYLCFRAFGPEDLMPIFRQFQRVRCAAVDSHTIWDLDNEESRLNFDDDRVFELIASRIHGVGSKPLASTD